METEETIEHRECTGFIYADAFNKDSMQSAREELDLSLLDSCNLDKYGRSFPFLRWLKYSKPCGGSETVIRMLARHLATQGLDENVHLLHVEMLTRDTIIEGRTPDEAIAEFDRLYATFVSRLPQDDGRFGDPGMAEVLRQIRWSDIAAERERHKAIN